MYFPVNFFLMKLLLLSILMIMSSSNWLMLWMSFELNTLFFIPFMKSNFYLYFTESMMKYFLVQSICSIVLILSWLIFYKSYLIFLILIIKMGLPPFHWWVMDFLKINNWMLFFYLMTLQKVSLFILMMYFSMDKMIISSMIILSMLISIISTYFLNNILFILLFSSMIHSSWLLSSLLFSMKLWGLYFFFYFIFLLLLINFLKKMNVYFFSQNFFSLKWSIFWILMGMPPFSIFIMKWSISIFIMKWSISIFTFFMLVSFLSLYIYFKFIYLNFLSKSSIFLNSIFLNSIFKMFLIELIMIYILMIL